MANRTSKGEWAWNPELLLSKVEQGNPDDCWAWRGAVSPHANLFGAYKNGRQQMCQANRLLWMQYFDEDITDLEVRHHCSNRHCCNINHMFTQPNHLKFHKTGEPLGTKLPFKPQSVKMKPVKDPRTAWWKL